MASARGGRPRLIFRRFATDLKHADLVTQARFSNSKAALERRIEGEALNQQYFLDLVLNTSSLNVLKNQLTWLRSRSNPLQDGGR